LVRYIHELRGGGFKYPPPWNFRSQNLKIKWLFWLKNVIFSENFWDLSRFSQICSKIFKFFLTPSPPYKIFLNPNPLPKIFGQARRSRLTGSLWDRWKLISITDWF
jgi:hypothetical protein